jgi:hypothetical protein
MRNIASPSSSLRRGDLWFWVVAGAFTVVMAFTTAPTPLWSVFAQRDRFSSLVAGAGAGLMFKGAIGTVSEISLPEHRAEALAGLFLAAYLGLAGPVIGLGALTQITSTRVSLLVFSGLLALGVFSAAPALLGDRRRGPRASAQPQPTSR